MPKKLDEEAKRIHVWLYDNDIERIKAFCGEKIKFSAAVRLIIRAFLKEIEQKQEIMGRRVTVDPKEIEELL